VATATSKSDIRIRGGEAGRRLLPYFADYALVDSFFYCTCSPTN
jgi:hypothetical protein